VEIENEDWAIGTLLVVTEECLGFQSEPDPWDFANVTKHKRLVVGDHVVVASPATKEKWKNSTYNVHRIIHPAYGNLILSFASGQDDYQIEHFTRKVKVVVDNGDE